MLDNVLPFQQGFVQVDHLTEPAGEHKKKENHPKQETRKPRWAGKEGSAAGPTCQHQKGRA